MPRFRPRLSDDILCDIALSPEMVRWLCDEVTRLCHFFSRLTLGLLYVPAEDSVWEIFQGRLLDPAHTRQRCAFEAWNIYQVTDDERSGEPLLSLKWDHDANQIHVVRGIDSYVQEGYDSGGGVFLTRERRKWVRELVGTVELTPFRDLEELRDELICLLFDSVVGTSRLPLAPVETPLPAFSFGELFYCYRASAPDSQPLHTYQQLLDDMLSRTMIQRERAKWLETFLHTIPESHAMIQASDHFIHRWEALGETIGSAHALLRSLFNEVSLSPYTDLVSQALLFLSCRELTPRAEREDSLAYLMRQTGRHLTAYDLITFHYRGANYPDALLLDDVLIGYQSTIEMWPFRFLDASDDDVLIATTKRLRRRALRQGWVHYNAYEGYPVPDAPTSPGEQKRVLPSSYPRVSEEQILQPAKRTRHLFADSILTNYRTFLLTPNVQKVLRQSLADLEHPDELRELGMAIYLDRPFNFGKPPAEPDGTLLLSAEAFSRNLALQRLHKLPRWFEGIADAIPADCDERLRNLPVAGLPLDRIGSPARPGVIALTDARLASPDFVFLRTTTSTVRNFLALYDVTPLAERFDIAFLIEARRVLFARAPSGDGVMVYDGELRPRLELHVPANRGYEHRAGHEYPAAGVWVVGVWQADRRIDLRDAPIVLKVR